MRTSTFALILAAICTCALFSSTARADSYGLDEVPNSHFYHGPWNFYGSDPVPTSTTHANTNQRTSYGWDPVPDMHHPHVDHHHNLLLIEQVQELTSSREMNPPAPVKAQPRRLRTR